MQPNEPGCWEALVSCDGGRAGGGCGNGGRSAGLSLRTDGDVAVEVTRSTVPGAVVDGGGCSVAGKGPSGGGGVTGGDGA